MEKRMRTQKETMMRAGIALLLSFILTGIWFIIVYQKIPFVYNINDDVAMRNVAAGVITGEPDAHLLHIKYLLGLFISGLYRLLEGFDWYGLVMIGIVLVSFAMILYRGLSARKGIFWKLVYSVFALLLFTALGMQHVSAFQWTTTAGIAGAAGIYLFYSADRQEGLLLYLEEGIAVFLILLSLAVRDDVFLMVLPIAGFCFWWKYGTLRRETNGKWKLRLRHWGVPAGLLAGVVLILGMEAFAYRSPEWRDFREYNVNREAIMDYYGIADYEEDQEFYEKLGMSPEETENLQRYSLYLVEGLYPEKMEALARRSRENYLEQHTVGERIRVAASEIYEHLGKDTYHLTNLAALFMIALTLGICFGKDRRQLGLVLCVLICWGAYWCYLGYRDRILERVGFVLYLLIFLTMLAIWYHLAWNPEALPQEEGDGSTGEALGKRLTSGAVTVILGVFLLLLACINVKAVKEDNTSQRDYNLQFLDVNRYMAEHPENVYFMTTFSIETYTDNFTIRRECAFSNLLSVGGWHTYSPLENVKDEKLGITDPKYDITEKENVYLISLENVNLRYLDRYYESLYGERYQGRELVDALDYGEQVFEVYDFSAEEEAK